MKKTLYDYAIIGAGISGLSCAYYLLKSNPSAKIIILEKSPSFGGKIQTQKRDGFLIEEAPDCFLTRKKAAVELCGELGILEELIGRIPDNNKTFVKNAGKLYPLPSGLTGLVPTDFSAIETCEFISKTGRERFTKELTVPVLESDEEESIAQFMSRRFGKEIYEKLIEPLMAGIYGGDGSQLSINATFPKLPEMEKKYGSVIEGLKKTSSQESSSLAPFVSFPNGMSSLIEALQKKLDGVEIFLNAKVLDLGKISGGYELSIDSKNLPPLPLWERAGVRGLISSKNVIFACEAHATAKILENFSPTLSELHKAIPYGSTVLANFVFKKSDLENLPKSYGYIIPRIENSKILACTFTSQKWPGRAPEDSVLIRVYMNRYNGPDISNDKDEAILNLALEELSSIMKIKNKPIFTKIFRWPQSMPQYVMGHENILKEIQAENAKHKGLKFIGAAYQGVGIPDCISSALN